MPICERWGRLGLEQATPGYGTRRPTVAVFGGGIAGLTAAHELAERGFDVTIYERRASGGKARSTEVPGSRPPEDVVRFVGRLAVFFSSCDARRLGQWERTSWTEFAQAERFSEDFRRIVIKTFSELPR